MGQFAKHEKPSSYAIFRALRKSYGLSQANMASKLGIVQSTVSKIEKENQGITAALWFHLCDCFEISPDCYNYEFIDYLPTVEQRGGFKIPKKFSENAESTVRSMQPFISIFKKKYGEKKFKEYLKSEEIDSDFFVVWSNRLNIAFNLGLAKKLIESRHLTTRTISTLTSFASQTHTHGKLGEKYSECKDPFKRLKTLVVNGNKYDSNFDYSIGESSKNKLIVGVKGKDHLKNLSVWEDLDLSSFINCYHLEYLKSFSSKFDRFESKDVSIVMKKEMLKNKQREAVYEIARI